MARNSYYVDPSQKHLDAVMRFNGALNTETAEEQLMNNELPMVVNFDLTPRGSLKRRTGMALEAGGPGAGMAQGFFILAKAGGVYSKIQAMGGKLYLDGVEKVSGLQTTRVMEAVQWGDKMYIATGSGLYVVQDGTIVKVTPYKPQPLEALYVGTNALADDPSSYLQDGVSAYVSILGVTVDKRYGVVNEPITATAYVNKPAADTVEYKFEIKLIAEPYDKWVTFRDWNTSKSASFTKPEAGEYELMVSARKQGSTYIDSYYSVPKYIIKPMADPADVPVPHDTIDDCNRILLHQRRLVMYGDPTQKDVAYISHLDKPDYWPISNSLRFTAQRTEELTSLVPFRDSLVAFTDSTVQALYGKSPQDFRRVILNTAVGCVAPYSAKAFDNYVAFLSNDGVYILKSLGLSEDKANVQLISQNVQSEISADKEAVAEVCDNQYHLFFPSQEKRLRYYYQHGVWVKDKSPHMNMQTLAVYRGELYGMAKTDGTAYRFADTVLTDDGYEFESYVETKGFDFGEAFKKKKLREVQLLTGAVETPTTVEVEFYVDNKLVLATTVDLAVTTGITTTLNGFASDKTIVKVSGKGRAIKVILRHTEGVDFHLLALGFIFKLKTP